MIGIGDEGATETEHRHGGNFQMRMLSSEFLWRKSNECIFLLCSIKIFDPSLLDEVRKAQFVLFKLGEVVRREERLSIFNDNQWTAESALLILHFHNVCFCIIIHIDIQGKFFAPAFLDNRLRKT